MGALSQQRAAASPNAAPSGSGAVGPSQRLAGLRIGVYGSGGAPWHHLALLAVNGASVAVVRAEDVAAGRLADLDALVFPGGGATAMAGLIAPLGEAGATAVRAWVERGGTYVGSCAGSVLPVALAGAADEAVPAARCLRLVDVPLANTGDEMLGGLASPGVGRIRVRLDPSHPFCDGLPEVVELVHYNGPLFDLARAGSDVSAFAWPVAATEGFTHAERFLEAPGAPETPGPTEAGQPPPSADEVGTTLERCIAAGAATGVVAALGTGRALLFGSHPEFGLGPLGLGWGAGETLLVRALETAVSGPRTGASALPDRSAPFWATAPERPGASAAALADEAVTSLRSAAGRFTLLARAAPDGWLEPGYAASFHGTPAKRAWAEELSAAAEACLAAAEDLEALADHEASTQNDAPAGTRWLGEADLPWLDDAPRAGQDFGAMGLLQVLATLHGQLDAAERALTRAPARPAHAYDLFDSHPFHLAMGSYLSAAGMAAAALLTVTVIAARRETVGASCRRLLWKGTTCS